jgi:hypothetical protein
MTNENVIWVNTSSLVFNPLWSEKSIINSWKYSCLMTEISVYGIITPIVITNDNYVIDGNIRLQIALELNFEKVPVVFFQDNENGDLVTKKIKPSDLVKILELLESKYNLSSNTRFNKKGISKVLISLRRFYFGGEKRARQIHKINLISKKIKSSYPVETKEVWDELDGFHISVEQGILKMEKLYQRRTTLNFTIDIQMTA